MYDDDWSIFLGFGSCHDLRDAEDKEPRLWQAKSVSRAAAIALARKPAPTQRQPIGFHRPR